MKKYISFFVTALVLSLGLASCSTETDEPAGGTAVEDMCGHWVVTCDVIYGGENLGDYYGLGQWDMITYNTANNDQDVMWISDQGNFWGYTGKMQVDYNAKTFSCKDVYIYTFDVKDDEGNVIGQEDAFMTITNGKIIKNGGENVNGKPTDAIEYDIQFSDDDPDIVYHIHGVRYAGF